MGSSNINRTFFLKRRDALVKRNNSTGSYEEDTKTVMTYHCVYLSFSVVITMIEQVVHSAVEQSSFVKFVTSENVKPADILTGLKTQIGVETQGASCMTVITHLKKAEQMMKTCGDYTFCRGSYGQSF
jgi:hypothetical protein